MGQIRATISGVVRDRVCAIEVSAETYERFRTLKSAWGLHCDHIVSLATSDGRSPLTEAGILDVLGQLDEAGQTIGTQATVG